MNHWGGSAIRMSRLSAEDALYCCEARRLCVCFKWQFARIFIGSALLLVQDTVTSKRRKPPFVCRPGSRRIRALLQVGAERTFNAELHEVQRAVVSFVANASAAGAGSARLGAAKCLVAFFKAAKTQSSAAGQGTCNLWPYRRLQLTGVSEIASTLDAPFPQF